jgi:hypothetical protein
MCVALPRLLILDGEAFCKVAIQYETRAVVGTYLSGALVMLRESKFIIVVPNGQKPKAGTPYPFGTKVYVNAVNYKETSFTDKKAGTARINTYNRGLAGDGGDCGSSEDYEAKYMTLQCVEKVLRDHKERGLFSLWDCDCKPYVYEKQCRCSVLARHLDPGDEMNIDNLLQELPQNKKAGRPSSTAKIISDDSDARQDAQKRGSVAVPGE